MPQKDRVHDLVRRLLEEAGWVVTHDPLYLRMGDRKTYVDLGAETTLGAERGDRPSPLKSKVFSALPQ